MGQGLWLYTYGWTTYLALIKQLPYLSRFERRRADVLSTLFSTLVSRLTFGRRCAIVVSIHLVRVDEQINVEKTKTEEGSFRFRGSGRDCAYVGSSGMQVLSDYHQASEGGTNGTRGIYEKIMRKKSVLNTRPLARAANTQLRCRATQSAISGSIHRPILGVDVQ